MNAEERDNRARAEAHVRAVLKNYVYWRNLSDGYSGIRVALKPEPHEAMTFRDLSEMRTWLIDIENVKKAVNGDRLQCASCLSIFAGVPLCPTCNTVTTYRRIAGFDVWGLVGDHLYCGIGFHKLASVRRMSYDGVKAKYWDGVAAIFLELLGRGINEEYRDQAA
jgi:hypothetical protein